MGFKARIFSVFLLLCVGLVSLSGLRSTVFADANALTERRMNWQAPVNTGGVSVGEDAVDGVLSADEELVFEVNFPEYTEAVDVYVAVAIPDRGGFFVTAEGGVVPFEGNNFEPYSAGVTRVPSLGPQPISVCGLPSGEYKICSLVVPTGTDLFSWLFGNIPGELNCYSFRLECESEPVEQGEEAGGETEGEIGEETGDEVGFVDFADPNLEACVRRYVGLRSPAPIPLERVRTITEFVCVSRNITDLSGLEYFTSLEELHLSGNQINDITPLANLTNLEELNLSGNQINDITPLANLTNLEELNLSGNQIENITPLANLTNLEELNLSGNQIENITPLANLTNLWHLNLCENLIIDYYPIRELNIPSCNCCWLESIP